VPTKQILVATPGRLIDHLENTPGFATRIKGVKVLVLDEADRLLDMGFKRDIEKIISFIPKERQTLLFSATVPAEVSPFLRPPLCTRNNLIS
jgi:ATP-dependent RNA helicase MSS116